MFAIITPIVKVKLYEEVSNHIIEMIKLGEWRQGEKIPTETQLSEIFKVSRSTVREAVKSLQISGILTSKTGTGTFVSEDALQIISSGDLIALLNDEAYIAELVETRCLIEPYLSYLAAKNPIRDDVDKLFETIEQMKKCTRREEMLDIGFVFHKLIAEMSGNKILTGFYNSMSAQLLKMRNLDFLTLEVYNKDIADHTHIANAIKNKDSAGASELMKKHLQNDYQKYLK